MLRSNLLAASTAALLTMGLAAPAFPQSAESQGVGTETGADALLSQYDERYQSFRDEQARRLDQEYQLFVDRQREQYGDGYASTPEYRANYNAWERYQMRRMGRDYVGWMDQYSSRVSADAPMGAVVVTYGTGTSKERCLDDVAMLADEALRVSGAADTDAAIANARRMCESGQIADAQAEINTGFEALHEATKQGEPGDQ